MAVAQLFVQLMARLGFDKFYAQGGDWGSLITTDMAVVFPDRWRMGVAGVYKVIIFVIIIIIIIIIIIKTCSTGPNGKKRNCL